MPAWPPSDTQITFFALAPVTSASAKTKNRAVIHRRLLNAIDPTRSPATINIPDPGSGTIAERDLELIGSSNPEPVMPIEPGRGPERLPPRGIPAPKPLFGPTNAVCDALAVETAKEM